MTESKKTKTPQKTLYRVNMKKLFRALNFQRSTYGFSWRELGRELGFSSSTFTHLKNGKKLDIDTFVTICVFMHNGPTLDQMFATFR